MFLERLSFGHAAIIITALIRPLFIRSGMPEGTEAIGETVLGILVDHVIFLQSFPGLLLFD